MFVLEKWYLNDLLKYVAFVYIVIILLRIGGTFFQWVKPKFEKLKLLYYSKFPKKAA